MGRRAKLTFKSGDTEVRYEADREAVEAQLGQILDRLLQDAPAGVQVGLTDARAEAAGHPSRAAPPDASPAPEEPAALSDARQLARLYRIGKGGRLRLRKLPGRTADTLLLVLYGMLKLQDRSSVHAPGMTSAAELGGRPVELISTPKADAVVRAARARFIR